jgi:hypothetical protein
MLAAVFTQAGFPARRGVQYQGGSDSPDIVCPDLARWHWEAKFTEQCRLPEWLAQVEGDRQGKPWIIAWRRRRGPWLALIDLNTLLDIIRLAILPAPIKAAPTDTLAPQPTPCGVEPVAER